MLKSIVIKIKNKSIMRTIKALCDKEDTFKYSILISIHYYDINCHPERITKLKPFENEYKFANNTHTTFEKNNPNVSLTVIVEDSNTIHKPANNADKKATLVKLKDNTYTSLKPPMPKHIKLSNFLKKYTQRVN